jgi:hypothetical protein
MESWRCESLRLTAIWADGRDASALLTWEEVVGSPPDQRENHPKLRSTREVGSINENSFNLDMRATPGRVDWFVTPIRPTSPNEEVSPFRSLPVVSDALDAFAYMIFEKSVNAYDAVRFALGVAAVRPTASVRASYEDLARLLPDIKVPLEGASELFFQINRPRKSKLAAGHELNRLSRWMSVASGQVIFPQITLAYPPIQIRGDSIFATRVELDISTGAERQMTIPQDERRLLLNEMLDFAKESLESGDRP